jgi:hypothetical protein
MEDKEIKYVKIIDTYYNKLITRLVLYSILTLLTFGLGCLIYVYKILRKKYVSYKILVTYYDDTEEIFIINHEQKKKYEVYIYE